MTKKYDYFVIGAGSGGVRSARIAATYGAKVGIAESDKFGGTCVNLGCIPKKLMVYASDYGKVPDEARGYGWDYAEGGFDWNTLIKNKDKEISRLNGIYDKVLNDTGVDIIRGHASFKDAHTLDIDGKDVKADKVLIAVGGKPRIPDVPGKEHLSTSDDVFFLPEKPEKVVIVGGGYIAVEFAHIFNGLGCSVTLLYYKDLFLSSFDIDIRKTLADEMRKRGITLCFNCDLERIEKDGDKLKVCTTTGDYFETDLALAAIGRVGNTDTLNLEAAGIQTDKYGRIPVNENYQTSDDHIYALGDVTDTYHLTPVAIAEGHVLADRLFAGRSDKSVNYCNIPTVIFSGPPIGTVGFSESQARDNGHEVECYMSHFTPLKHQLTGCDEKTMMKLVVDKNTGKVLGCHMVGMDAAEIMQGFAVALNMGATKADFDRTIAIHPTASEEFVLMRTPISDKDS